jgi:hypothetical protein
MAKFKGSDISGMVGPLVFLKLRGQGVIRMAPGKRSKNAWSDAQKKYRMKVSKLAFFWSKTISKQLHLIFSMGAENMSAYNLFLKTNLGAFSDDGTQIDFERMHLSVGKLPLPHKMRAQRVAGDPEKVEASWIDDSEGRYADAKDELMMVVAYEGKFSAPIATGAYRSQETAVIQLPAVSGTVQGIYLSFASRFRERYSPDQWFGL